MTYLDGDGKTDQAPSNTGSLPQPIAKESKIVGNSGRRYDDRGDVK